MSLPTSAVTPPSYSTCQDTLPPSASELGLWDQMMQSATTEINLPPALDSMDEAERSGLSYAFDSQDILALEVKIAERRYHQMILMARIHFLRLQTARQKLEDIKQRVDWTLNAALEEVRATRSQVGPQQPAGGGRPPQVNFSTALEGQLARAAQLVFTNEQPPVGLTA